MNWNHSAEIETIIAVEEHGVLLFEAEVTVAVECATAPDDGSFAAFIVKRFDFHKHGWDISETGAPRIITTATRHVGPNHPLFSVLAMHIDSDKIKAAIIAQGDFPAGRSDAEEHHLFKSEVL